MSKVYSFGPTFRAENSNTSRHLAEFWMVEPEVAFADLEDVISLAEGCVTSTIKAVMEECPDDISFFNQRIDPELEARLWNTIDQPFARLTYTEAVDVLQQSGEMFATQPQWGCSLQSDHERYLAEQHCQSPVFVTHYPAAVKPFYMRRSDRADGDVGDTVEATDLLVPGLGELIGGSAREERQDVLYALMSEAGLLLDENDASGGLQWYFDLRRYGTVPHAGWGMGFERLIQHITGLENIRDTIPVPRYPGHCRF